VCVRACVWGDGLPRLPADIRAGPLPTPAGSAGGAPGAAGDQGVTDPSLDAPPSRVRVRGWSAACRPGGTLASGHAVDAHPRSVARGLGLELAAVPPARGRPPLPNPVPSAAGTSAVALPTSANVVAATTTAPLPTVGTSTVGLGAVGGGGGAGGGAGGGTSLASHVPASGAAPAAARSPQAGPAPASGARRDGPRVHPGAHPRLAPQREESRPGGPAVAPQPPPPPRSPPPLGLAAAGVASPPPPPPGTRGVGRALPSPAAGGRSAVPLPGAGAASGVGAWGVAGLGGVAMTESPLGLAQRVNRMKSPGKDL
jgi:hypothetical protein